MITKQVGKRLPMNYELRASQIHKFGDNLVRVGGSFYYILTSGGDMEESVLDFRVFASSAIEDTIEIWGSESKHLRPTEKRLPERLIKKEIDVDNLVAAINATDEEINQWLGWLLEDYDIDLTVENIEATSSLIRFWLEQQASQSGLKLEEDELSKLFRFTVRLAYEALYVGSV